MIKATTVTKAGHASWNDLIGKRVSFEWFEDWEDMPNYESGIVLGTQVYWEDPRYPRYYVITTEGGASFWESEGVRVAVEGPPEDARDKSWKEQKP